MAIKQLIKEVYSNMVERTSGRKKQPVKKYVMSECDVALLARLGDFRTLVHALNPDEHETQLRLVQIWREVGYQLNPVEYQGLSEGWSWYNKTDDATKIDQAVGRITARIESGNIY